MSVRTTAPSSTNKYYIRTAAGGYNKCIAGNAENPYKKRPTNSFVLPNCVGYAYGRYLEFWGLKSANLPTCNAKDWDNVAKANGFKVTKTPTVGSIAVFEGTTYGHVAFVERIEPNGDLYLSESNWGHQYFRNVTVNKLSNYNYSSGLKCVGFVTNPNPPKVETPKVEEKKPVTLKYKPGNYKVNVDVLRVRTKPGITYNKVTFEKLTMDAQRKILQLNKKVKADGYVRGLQFTAKEVTYNEKDGYTWGKTPSGWVALDLCVKVS